MDPNQNYDHLEQKFKICVEIFFSKIEDLDILLSYLDASMSALHEELTYEDDSQEDLIFYKNRHIEWLINLLVLPILYFIEI